LNAILDGLPQRSLLLISTDYYSFAYREYEATSRRVACWGGATILRECPRKNNLLTLAGRSVIMVFLMLNPAYENILSDGVHPHFRLSHTRHI